MEELEMLRNRYRDITGISAPRCIRKKMLIRLIDWHIGCICHGIDQKEAFFYRHASIQSVQAGEVKQVLLREWNGKVHVVKRCSDGRFRFGNRKFSSLTRIAREITGSHRSGPAFFRAKGPVS